MLKAGSVTISDVSCNNYPMRGLWYDFSWTLTTNMQAMWRFESKVVKSCKMVCRPVMKKSIALGLECSKHCPSCSSLCELAILVCM